MPHQCFMAQSDEEKHSIGAMWYGQDDFDWGDFLSIEFKQQWEGKRHPLCVRLPDGSAWCVDTIDTKRNDGHGWTITGTAPNITAQPSINIPGRYHGFLTDGVLADDIEGRSFDQI